MPHVCFQQKTFALNDKETVLECLLRNGKSIPNSCNVGVCQNCMLQAVKGTPSPKSQEGLKPTYQTQGYVLSCQWKPEEDVEVKIPSLTDITSVTEILEITSLSYNITGLRLKLPEGFSCFPGQYLTLINDEGIARSYSIANLPQQDHFIECHIKIIPDGQMSQWIATTAQTGQKINIRGPAGNCFYVKDESQAFPMVLAGTGAGLAPLYGIILDALSQNHSGDITLFQGALKPEDLYYVNEIQNLSNKHPNFSYIPCSLEGSQNDFYQVGNIEDIIMSNLPQKENIHAYLCGTPDLVRSLQKKLFLSGVASNNIFMDAFLPTASKSS